MNTQEIINEIKKVFYEYFKDIENLDKHWEYRLRPELSDVLGFYIAIYNHALSNSILLEASGFVKVPENANEAKLTLKHTAIRQGKETMKYLVDELSKELSTEEVINNCDGCQSNAPLKGIYHLAKNGEAYMICQKHRYAKKEEQPELDELEKWVNGQIKFSSSTYHIKILEGVLTKIQELRK